MVEITYTVPKWYCKLSKKREDFIKSLSRKFKGCFNFTIGSFAFGLFFGSLIIEYLSDVFSFEYIHGLIVLSIGISVWSLLIWNYEYQWITFRIKKCELD